MTENYKLMTVNDSVLLTEGVSRAGTAPPAHAPDPA